MSKFRVSTSVLWLLFAFSGAGSLQARTFTDSAGKKIEADFVRTEGANVIIRMGGKEFSVPMTRFSAADQQFFRDSAKGVAPTASPAPEVKPGETLTLDFPDLTHDRKDQPAQCHVSIPAGYDPAKKIPLVIWLSGGDGGNTPNRSFLPPGDFVAAGLPYPKGANNPGQANMVGEFDKIWAYHRKMIEEIVKRVPNIDRASSILAGFSNGGHSIDGMLRLRKKEGTPADYFGIFILVDGGGTEYTSNGSLPSLKGKFAYLCWGETSPAKGNVSGLVRDFKTKGATYVSSEMAATGHAFAETEQVKIKDWLAKSVFPVLTKSAEAAPGK